MSDITQCVYVNEEISDFWGGQWGASGLSTWPFIVYIYDLFNYLPPERGIFYADDTFQLRVTSSLDIWDEWNHQQGRNWINSKIS